MASFGLFRGNDVNILLGTLSLKDMRADTFVRIRYDEAMFGTIKGSDGSITRYATGNTLAFIDFICKRSSNENQKLSILLNSDIVVGGGAGVSSFALTDPNGATNFASGKTWVQGFPDSEFGKEVGGDVTWVLASQVLPGTHIIGGNQL